MDQNPYEVGNNLDPPDAGPQTETFEGSVRSVQIVAGALMAGVLVFFGVVLVSTGGDIFGTQTPEIVGILGVLFGFIAIVNQFIIPKVIAGAQLRQIASDGFNERDEVAKLNLISGVYRGQLIVGLALLEGAAFLNLVGLMLERSIVSLAIVIVLLGSMALKFPTRDKVSFWVQDKLRELS